MENLYCDNRKLVFAFIKDYCNDAATMEDIASTVWLKVWEHSKTILALSKTEVQRYLRLTVKTTVSDYYRHLEKQKHMEDELYEYLVRENLWDNKNQQCLNEELKEYLYNTLNDLSDEDKMLIVFRFMYNKSAKDVGIILGLSEVNVRVKQFRILHKMRNSIEKFIEEGKENDNKR